LSYRQTRSRLTTVFAGGVRAFTPPINPGAQRALEYGLQTEGRLVVRATEGVYLWAALYLETLANDFNSDATSVALPHHGEPLLYRILQLGVSLRDDQYRVLSLYLKYSRSHGRGINFVRRYGDEAGVGISSAF